MIVAAPRTAPLAQAMPEVRPSLQLAAPASVEQYYAPVAGKHGADLVDGVHDLLVETHHGGGYDSARDFMFSTLDRAADGSGMVDLYSGATLKGVNSRAQANGAGVNTEHIWPQSQGATGILRSDLQHLGATTQLINQYRWHLPYGAVQDAQDGAAPYQIPAGAGSVGFDGTGRLVFEPNDATKGVIARRLMYVHEHYGVGADHPEKFDERNFTDSLPTLLAWNAAHLPDAEELRRNDLVAGWQGTRNPFVDHPEWAGELMEGVATTPQPAPRDQQVDAWSTFLKDPAGHGKSHSDAA